MDNPTRWNISNSAQNIVSALVDPSQQFESSFRREWHSSFSGFSRHKASLKSKQDVELNNRLTQYCSKLESRRQYKLLEAQSEAEAIPRDSSGSNQSRIKVPEVFMMEHFDLSNLEIFNDVMSSLAQEYDHREGLDDNQSGGSMLYYQKSSSRELFTKRQLKDFQQILTDYLDVIEEQLSSQISNRSGDFFQVMSSVDSVMDELSSAIKSVTNLRNRCSNLNDSLVWPNMKIIHITRNRSNAKSVLDKMEDIAYLCKVQPMIQLLLSASDFVGALDLISKSRDLLRKKLNRVVSLKHLESQLVEIERVIGTMMQQEFVTLITSHTATEFNNLSKLVSSFANGFSEISERNSFTLLSLLQTQAEKFVNKFHEERKRLVESNLDIEQWKMVEDIPVEFQTLVTMLVDKNASIDEALTVDLQPVLGNQTIKAKTVDRPQHNRTSSDTAASAIAQKPGASSANSLRSHESPVGGTQKYVKAGGSTYVIVNSVISLVQTIIDYCKCAQEIRPLSAELLERLFKILQLYNSKTYHLVYRAGAIQVAGLKTITTRSLIVSQRSLKLITLLIPAIQHHFSQLLPHHNRLRRFDEIRLSYEDHAAKIPERVSSIVRDVINLRLQEWEAKPPVPSPQFSAIAQHLMRLHDSIQDALPHEELSHLFAGISDTFKEVLIMHLRRLNIHNDSGPQQWIVTQELTFYKISSTKLDIFKGLELNFDDIWSKLNSSMAQTTTTTTSLTDQNPAVKPSIRPSSSNGSLAAASTDISATNDPPKEHLDSLSLSSMLLKPTSPQQKQQQDKDDRKNLMSNNRK